MWHLVVIILMIFLIINWPNFVYLLVDPVFLPLPQRPIAVRSPYNGRSRQTQRTKTRLCAHRLTFYQPAIRNLGLPFNCLHPCNPRITTHLPTPEGWRAELAWLVDHAQRTPSHRSGHMLTVDRAQIRKVRQPKTGALTTEPRRQPLWWFTRLNRFTVQRQHRYS